MHYYKQYNSKHYLVEHCLPMHKINLDVLIMSDFAFSSRHTSSQSVTERIIVKLDSNRIT